MSGDTEITETGVFKWEWQKEIDRLHADNAGLSRSLNASVAELDELIAERDRLRAALEWYAKGKDGYVARAALEEMKK